MGTGLAHLPQLTVHGPQAVVGLQQKQQLPRHALHEAGGVARIPLRKARQLLLLRLAAGAHPEMVRCPPHYLRPIAPIRPPFGITVLV